MTDITMGVAVDAKAAIAAVNELTAAVTRATEALAGLHAMLAQPTIVTEVTPIDSAATMQPVADAIDRQTEKLTALLRSTRMIA